MTADLLSLAVRVFTGAQARWNGCPPQARLRIYFANHTSNLDFLVLWSVLPDELRARTRPVAARDYWEGGPIRRYLARDVFRAVLIERQKVTRANNPIEAMVPVLQGGDSLIIFPEGGRSADGEMKPFRSGLYRLAKAVPQAELVPVYLDNANRVLPKGEALPVPLICSATFGPPLALEMDEPKEAFLLRAAAAVKSLAH